MSDQVTKDRTNAERQRRYRERMRNSVTRNVTPALHEEPGWWNGAKTNELTVARNLAAGMSQERALLAAGQSPKATILIEKGRQRLADVLREKALTLERVADSTNESMGAVTPVWNPNGSDCIEKPDWNARAQGRRDAIALLDRAGELPSASNTQHGAQITINIVRFSGGPQDVVDDARIIETQATEHSQVCENTED